MRRHSVQPHLRAWFLGRVDALLTEEQRRLPPDELSRLRVLVGAAALNFVLALATVLGPEAPTHGTLYRGVGLLFTGGYLSVLVMVRRAAPFRRSALLLCTILTVGIVLSTFMAGAPQAETHAVIMLIPALAVYLLGPRLGVLFTALMGLNALVLHPLFRGELEADRQLLATEQVRLSVHAALLALVGGWCLSWLHSVSRAEAHAALQQSEGRLVSLIESTDDLVCSFNAEGRLLTANQAVRRLLRQASSEEPTLSASFLGLLQPEVWREQLAQALAGRHQRFEVSASPEGRPLVLDIRLNPILGGRGERVGVTLFGRDITARKEAEARLEGMHRSLLEVSRQAGKAEVAAGVLHNLGNTLNSVTVSTQLVAERARGLRVASVARVGALLHEHAGELGTFLTADPRGRKLPAYLQVLSQQLATEQAALVAEVEALGDNVEQLRTVVDLQQEHARAVGIREQVSVAQLLHDALRLQGGSFEPLGIQVRSEYAPVPPVLVDRYKLLQVLSTLLSHARHALVESTRPEKQLLIRAGPTPEGRLRIEVADNGVGIPPEHLPRLFSQDFTPGTTGHGFGLHMSALAAAEMGGSLTCVSAGREQGATFTLELPLEPGETRA